MTETELAGWVAAREVCGKILDCEAVQSNLALLSDPSRRALLGADVRARLAGGEAVTTAEVAAARAAQPRWRTPWCARCSDGRAACAAHRAVLSAAPH